MSISLHVLYDELDQAGIERCYQWLKRNRPPYTNITGAARFQQAAEFAQYAHDNLGIEIILRNSGAWDGKPNGEHTDDGIHTRMSPEDWYERHARPYIGSDLILMTDNESVRNDMDIYAGWMAAVMDLADVDGLRLAVGATATGNPAEHHYAMMDEMWFRLAKRRHIYRPHSYMNATVAGSSGNLGRYRLAWEYCEKKLHIQRPITVIGEGGLLVNYDPEYGYKKLGMSGRDYARMCIAADKSIYAPDGVTYLIYAFCGNTGKWRWMNADDTDFLDTIEEYNLMQVTIDPFPSGDPTSTVTLHITSSSPFINLRAQPDVKAQDIGDLREGAELQTWPDGMLKGWYPVETADHLRGWVAASVCQLLPLVIALPPDPDLTALRDLFIEITNRANAGKMKLDELLDE